MKAEKRSGSEDSKELKKIERKMELVTYVQLQGEVQKMHTGGNVNLAERAKMMKSLSTSGGAPDTFSQISVAKLAIMELEDGTRLLKDIRSRIEELRSQEDIDSFTRVQEAFKNELPVTNLSVITKTSLFDSQRMYNPEGSSMSPLKIATSTQVGFEVLIAEIKSSRETLLKMLGEKVSK